MPSSRQSLSIRWGCTVGRDGFRWAGLADVGRKVMWPKWTPPKDMIERSPEKAKWASGMPGGPDNPLGARDWKERILGLHSHDQSGCQRTVSPSAYRFASGGVGRGSLGAVLTCPAFADQDNYG
jgi:lipoprotein-anchoring transpeptidase ErfK/SrfK